MALSGVEAVSNGVPAFQKPEPRNASRTLDLDGDHPRQLLLRVCACWPPTSSRSPRRTGTTGPRPSWAAPSSAASSVLYYVLQFATFAILILAANTAYADFPRLSSIIAGDGFLPRQLQNRGDRLVFSNGDHLPGRPGRPADRRLRRRHLGPHPAVRRRRLHRLHAVARPAWSCTTGGSGSPAGSVGLAINVAGRHHELASCSWSWWSRSSPIGAWIPVVVIPLFVLVLSVDRHGTTASVHDAVQSRRTTGSRGATQHNVVRPRRQRQPRRAGSRELRPVAGPRPARRRVDRRRRRGAGGPPRRLGPSSDLPVELHTIYSPYRELTAPVLKYLDELDAESPDDMITVVIPEFVTVVVDAVPAQPVRLRAEGPAALPPSHRRDLRTRRRRDRPDPARRSLMYSTLKRIFIGPPIASSEEHHHRLPKTVALAVFASDAISSTAYATEEILVVLVPARRVGGLRRPRPDRVHRRRAARPSSSPATARPSTPTRTAAAPTSCRRENLGRGAVARRRRRRCIVDYILTVAVSVSAGTAAITSAFADLRPYRVEIMPRLHHPDDAGQPPWR